MASEQASNVSPINASAASKRLPCRGCQPDCKNYHRCDGKLWRMPLTLPAVKTQK